jgi:hypothetical protein
LNFLAEIAMPQSPQNEARILELSKVIKTEQDMALLQEHLKEVTEGNAFKGSHRSGQFLRYIIEQAIAGHFESLKERVIGVELFGRSPTYDTGEDAIVRVTASEVRKRLLQHYGRYGSTSKFRINLHSGSYVPEILRELPSNDQAASSFRMVEEPNAAATLDNSIILSPSSDEMDSRGPLEMVAPPPNVGLEKAGNWFRYSLAAILVLAILNVAQWGYRWTHFRHDINAAAYRLPWSALLNSPHALQVVISDPDIAQIQDLTGQSVSVSDYANHRYVKDESKLTPHTAELYELSLGQNKGSLIDVPIAVRIAELAQTAFKEVDVHPARSIQLANLQTDDNFVMLGSPRSNPWNAYFSEPLSFRFIYDNASGQEIVRNLHPRPNEQAQYVPSALGGATGQSYAIVAFVRNPEQNGQVLLLAGANAEGTKAAAKLVTEQDKLSAAFKYCGLSSSGSVQHFELLLRLNMMAGSPTRFNVESCHILPGDAGQ